MKATRSSSIRRGGSRDADNQVVGVEILQLSLRAPSLEPGKLVFETTPAAVNG